jgi:hypothetical protein
MRLVSFLRGDGTPSYGTHEGETVRDSGAVMGGQHADLKAVIAADAVAALDGTGPDLALTPTSRSCRRSRRPKRSCASA